MNHLLHPTQSPGHGEAISDLMDGRLDASDSAMTVRRLLEDDAAQQTWHVYQVIGDVLRDPALAPTRKELDFASRLQAALAQEPLVPALMPAPVPVPAPAALPVQEVIPIRATGVPAQSANADVFRWKMVAGVASLGLGVVLALGLRGAPEESGAGRLAAVSVPGLTSGASAGNAGDGAGSVAPSEATSLAGASADTAMLRNPELDALLLAHQQMGGHSALQMPSGFLRNATYERAGR